MRPGGPPRGGAAGRRGWHPAKRYWLSPTARSLARRGLGVYSGLLGSATAGIGWTALDGQMVAEFGYLRANRTSIPNYGERYCAGETISSSIAESPSTKSVANGW